MEIYFIRHGETAGNVAKRHQAEKSQLTDRGRKQALEVAGEVAQYEPTHLLTSPLVRALQTASVIGEVVDLIPQTNTDFIELQRPSGMYGNFHLSPMSLWFYCRWFFGRTHDGESYEALRERIKRAKEHFKQYPEDARVAVVSHSVFINLFLAHMCDDEPMSLLRAAKVFRKVLQMKNTQIIPVMFDPYAGKGTCAWFPQ